MNIQVQDGCRHKTVLAQRHSGDWSRRQKSGTPCFPSRLAFLCSTCRLHGMNAGRRLVDRLPLGEMFRSGRVLVFSSRNFGTGRPRVRSWMFSQQALLVSAFVIVPHKQLQAAYRTDVAVRLHTCSVAYDQGGVRWWFRIAGHMVRMYASPCTHAEMRATVGSHSTTETTQQILPKNYLQGAGEGFIWMNVCALPWAVERAS